MKMKKWYLVALAIIIIMLVLIFTLNNKKEKTLLTFDNSLVVKNYTHYGFLDTISYILLDKIYDYDSLHVNIYYMALDMTIEGQSLYGFIQRAPIQSTRTYNIFLEREMSFAVEDILIHELVHLKQFEDGDLIMLGSKYVIYKGKKIDCSRIPYSDREFELEAFAKTPILKRQIMDTLYKKQTN